MSTAAYPSTPGHNSPFIEITRTNWAKLAATTPLPLNHDDVVRLRSHGDPLNLDEVRDIYLPLSRLLNLHALAAQRLHTATNEFLGAQSAPIPFVIGIAGSVAVGKSTIARLLQELLAHWNNTPRVALVTTDGFLLPNAELTRRGIMDRKGFPESYDRHSLLRFVTEIKSGSTEVRAPSYSHTSYDIVPGAEVIVRQPDILIIEGLNVLQQPAPGTHLAISDLFDFTIYVDAHSQDIARWYEERFLTLQQSASTDPQVYFHKFANFSEETARSFARKIWQSINEPNLVQNIRPTRSRARLVLRKDTNHAVLSVFLRKF